MSSQKQRRLSRLKKAMTFVLMGTVCLTAAASVAALTQTFEVSDPDVVVENKSEEKKNKEEIIHIDCAALENAGGEKALQVFNAAGSKENNFTMNVKENEAPALASKKKENKAEKENKETKEEVSEEVEESSEVSTNNDVNNDIVWYSVQIDLRGNKLNKKVPAGTVGSVLAYLDIQLTEYDSLNADLENEISDNENIVIKRTVVVTDVEEKEIGFKTVTKESETLFEGETKVDTEGEKGVKQITVEKTYVNGKFTSKKEVSSEVVKEPVDKVVLKGTAKKVDHFTNTENGTEVVDNGDGKTFVDASGNERQYVDVMTGSGTAYYAEPGASTATGRDAQYGVVAVNPNVIPYGSKLYIVSNDGEVIYGDAVAGDTGGGLMDNLILVDLFYPTYDECCVFGRRDVTIYILEYGNEFR